MPLQGTLVGSIPTVSMGWLAQLVRAPALHAGGRGFESLTTHVALVVEWYTRQSQKLLPLRDCEFESHREHLYGI